MEKELIAKVETLGIKEKKLVASKALEYLRLLGLKFPTGMPGMVCDAVALIIIG
jgi:hypothetical protein